MKRDPYNVSTEFIPAVTFRDHHGNFAQTQRELELLTNQSNLIENSYQSLNQESGVSMTTQPALHFRDKNYLTFVRQLD